MIYLEIFPDKGGKMNELFQLIVTIVFSLLLYAWLRRED